MRPEVITAVVSHMRHEKICLPSIALVVQQGSVIMGSVSSLFTLTNQVVFYCSPLHFKTQCEGFSGCPSNDYFWIELLLAPYFPRSRPHRLMVQPLQWSKLGRCWILSVASWLLASPWVLLQVPQIVPNQSVKRSCWQVSSFGRCRDTRGKITTGWPTAGYRRVEILGHKTLVHRLVAHAFLGPPPSKAASQVNHIDGNRSNNRKDNLEWVSHSENMRHSYVTNPSRGNGVSKRARPVMIRPLGSHKWTRFSSIKLAAEALFQPYDTVRERCHRNSQVDGYEYKFAPVQEVELPGEEWRPMIDPRFGMCVDGRMISSQGRIKSKAGHISFGTSREDRYLFTQINVGSNSQYQTERVHRLVAASFLGLPPSPERTQVNHKDGNKSNNAVDNLEYVTPAENMAHHSGSMKGPHPSSKAVLSRAYGTNEEWTHHPSVTSAAETLGLDNSDVSKCARGLRKQTGGHEVRFAEPEPCVVEILPGEVWCDVDLGAHLKDKEGRKQRQRQKRPT